MPEVPRRQESKGRMDDIVLRWKKSTSTLLFLKKNIYLCSVENMNPKGITTVLKKNMKQRGVLLDCNVTPRLWPFVAA